MDPATRYSVQEMIKIVEAYLATKSLIQTQRQFRRDFPGRNAPTRVTILRLLDKFRETGSVQDKNKGHSGRPRSARTDPNIDNVREHLARSPRKSTRRLSQETDLSRTSIMRIMHQDLHMFPYKIQILHAQTATNKAERLAFCPGKQTHLASHGQPLACSLPRSVCSRFLPLGVLKGKDLSQQSTDNRCIKGKHSS